MLHYKRAAIDKTAKENNAEDMTNWRPGRARHCILVLITTLKCTYSDIPRLAHAHTHTADFVGLLGIRAEYAGRVIRYVCRHFVTVITTASD